MDQNSQDMKYWVPQRREFYETAKRYGVEESMAFSLADFELAHWTGEELSKVLTKVWDMRPNRPKSAMTPRPQEALKMMSTLFKGAIGLAAPHEYRVKAPPELVKEAAVKGLALCVNAQGVFSLRSKDYVAISHVWSEGIQGDAQNRGIAQYMLNRIFQRLAGIAAEYIWVDVFAIPTGHMHLSAAEEKQKIDIINSLGEIYQNAAAVVIFDALVMDLQSTDPLDVAVTLLCGKWMTRVWTYQEIKLARRAIVVTGSGAVEYQQILAKLRESNAGLNYNTPDTEVPAAERLRRKKFRVLYMIFDTMAMYEPEISVSLPDIAIGCRHRVTGNQVDYARAFFPLLGLKWRFGMTREDGMRMIYEKTQFGYCGAARIMLMHGRPRAKWWPGWSPDSLCGLKGAILGKSIPFIRRSRGLEGLWHSFKITRNAELDPLHAPRALFFELVDEFNTHTSQCAGFYAISERCETVEAVKKLIREGRCYMLTYEPLKCRGATAVIVEKIDDAIADEAYVYLVIYVDAFKTASTPQQRKWLLRSENPMTEGYDGGKNRAEAFCLIEKTMVAESTVQGSQDISKQSSVIEKKDVEGRTQLHKAANPNQYWNLGSALSEAVQRKSLETARLLLQHGADPNDVDSPFMWPLLFACESLEMTELLLAHGADPNRCGETGLSAIMFAARAGDAAVVNKLIEQGARFDAHMNDDGRANALNMAIESQSHEVAAALLHYGANPNVRFGGGRTPLMLAAAKGNIQIVTMLLDAGADISAVDSERGWSALKYAEESERRVVIKILTERGVGK
jgi:ankyrin repeat protein